VEKWIPDDKGEPITEDLPPHRSTWGEKSSFSEHKLQDDYNSSNAANRKEP
jgi:hypothetical protein